MRVEHLYLESLKKFLTRYGFEPQGTWAPLGYLANSLGPKHAVRKMIHSAEAFLLPGGVRLARWSRFDPAKRKDGLDWPIHAETMVGLERLNQLHQALDTIEEEKIPGNILEAGVWRGGAMIFVAQYLNVWQLSGRKVFACDSFQGLPRAQKEFPVDEGDTWHSYDYLSVSLEQVQENFASYMVPMDNVVFVKGFFSESLENLDCGPLAILRMDGDMYSSTTQTLHQLFDKVSEGGFVIIDDWQLEGARKAVRDFLEARSLDPHIHEIKGAGAYFRVPK